MGSLKNYKVHLKTDFLVNTMRIFICRWANFNWLDSQSSYWERVNKKKQFSFVPRMLRFRQLIYYAYCKPTMICDDFIPRFDIKNWFAITSVHDQAVSRPWYRNQMTTTDWWVAKIETVRPSRTSRKILARR